jgi:large subunit ribosomal protein L14e
MVVIVDIVDMGRVLVDGLKNFPRVIYPLSRLTLTKMRLPLLRGARTTTLAKAAKAFGLDEKWAVNPSNIKMTKFSTRRNLTDLQRFQVMVARKQRSYALKHPNAKAGGKAKAAAPAKKAAAKKK